jgi:hypothetical protein
VEVKKVGNILQKKWWDYPWSPLTIQSELTSSQMDSIKIHDKHHAPRWWRNVQLTLCWKISFHKNYVIIMLVSFIFHYHQISFSSVLIFGPQRIWSISKKLKILKPHIINFVVKLIPHITILLGFFWKWMFVMCMKVSSQMHILIRATYDIAQHDNF